MFIQGIATISTDRASYSEPLECACSAGLVRARSGLRFPTFPTSPVQVGKLDAACLLGVPNLPNLPNLFSGSRVGRGRAQAHARVHTRACRQKKVGKVGKVGK